MGHPQSRKSILALKSWLFSPARKSDRFAHAADVHADALIIDLEDAVAPSAKREARATALGYLSNISTDHLPCALRINSLDTRFELDDLQEFFKSPAKADYLILPKCDSSAIIGRVDNLLREAGKSPQVIALIESAKAIATLDDIAGEAKPAALIFGAAHMAADLGAETAWEPLLCVRSRIVQGAATDGIAALDSPCFDIADKEGLKKKTKASASLGFRQMCNPSGTNRGDQ